MKITIIITEFVNIMKNSTSEMYPRGVKIKKARDTGTRDGKRLEEEQSHYSGFPALEKDE